MRNARLLSWLIAQLPCALWQIDNLSDTARVQLAPLWMVSHSWCTRGKKKHFWIGHKENVWLLMSMQNTVSPCVTRRPAWKFKHEKNATHTLYWEWVECVWPETLWSLYPLKYSKVQLLMALSSPCTEQEGGTTQPQEASTILSSSALLFGPYIFPHKKMLQVSNIICSSFSPLNSS